MQTRPLDVGHVIDHMTKAAHGAAAVSIGGVYTPRISATQHTTHARSLQAFLQRHVISDHLTI